MQEDIDVLVGEIWPFTNLIYFMHIQLISQILQLESCNVHATDPKLEAVAKEFCNLSLPERTRQTYVLGVTLLRHLDIYNFMYKVCVEIVEYFL